MCAEHDPRRGLRGQPRRRPAAVRQLQPGAAEQRGGHDPAAGRGGPIPEFSDITYSFNGGKSRYNALQIKYRVPHAPRLDAAEFVHVVNSKDNGSGSLEGPGQGPHPQTSTTSRTDYGTSDYDQPYNSITSFVWRVAVRPWPKWLADANGFVDAVLGGWTLSGINTMTVRRAGELTYTPSRLSSVSGISQDFRGANYYRANVNGDALGDKNSITNYLSTTTVTVPTDPASRSATRSATSSIGPWFWTLDMVASQGLPHSARRPDARAVPLRGVQPAEQNELPRAERQPQLGQLRHDHVHLRRPTDAGGVEADVLRLGAWGLGLGAWGLRLGLEALRLVPCALSPRVPLRRLA